MERLLPETPWVRFNFEFNDWNDKDSGFDHELKPIKINLPQSLYHVNATVLRFLGNFLHVEDSTKRRIHVVHLKMNRQYHVKGKRL
jgi:hypothetical protein